MLYFAYGSNLNMSQMGQRCPQAKPLGAAYFPNWRLVFRGVADIEYTTDNNSLLPVGIWDVTDQCLNALDAYEGVESGLYRRVDINGMLTYRMNSKGIHQPSSFYFDIIKLGYEDFDLDQSMLYEALHETRNIQIA